MRCNCCHQDLPVDAFYARNKSKCKECLKAEARLYRAANIDRYREYDRNRAMLPHRVEARQAYMQTDAGKAAHHAANERWRQKHPERKRAASLVKKALMRGKLARQPCEVCGATEVEAHHPDYSRPLMVVWLCNAHHRAAHEVTEPQMQIAA